MNSFSVLNSEEQDEKENVIIFRKMVFSVDFVPKIASIEQAIKDLLVVFSNIQLQGDMSIKNGILQFDVVSEDDEDYHIFHAVVTDRLEELKASITETKNNEEFGDAPPPLMSAQIAFAGLQSQASVSNLKETIDQIEETVIKKQFDLSPISHLLEGRETYFLQRMQELFGVQLSFTTCVDNPINHKLLLQATCEAEEFLNEFSNNMLTLIANPSTIDAFLCYTEVYDTSPFYDEIFCNEEQFIHALVEACGVQAEWHPGSSKLLILSSPLEDLLYSAKIFLDSFREHQDLLKNFIHPHKDIDISNCTTLILGTNNSVLNHLKRELSVDVKVIDRFENSRRKTFLQIYLKNNPDENVLTEIFIGKIMEILHDPAKFQRDLLVKKQKKVHIFVDVSNVTIGIQKRSGNAFNLSLSFSNLLDLVSNLRDPVKKVAVGSIGERELPEEKNPFWQRLKTEGFEVHTAKRATTSEGRSSEEAVDDILHAQILQDIANDYGGPPRTVVLVSGDGNNNKDRTSFPKVVEKAMLKGWSVELWAWREGTSQIYEKFAKEYSSHFTLFELDPHRDFLTFKKDSPRPPQPPPPPPPPPEMYSTARTAPTPPVSIHTTGYGQSGRAAPTNVASTGQSAAWREVVKKVKR